MKVLVIGGSGFVGSHVADRLSDGGHEVTIFARHPSPYLRDDQKTITGDVADEKAVFRAVREHDIVYNFAALANIDEAQNRPIETVRHNILGNAIALEAARQAQVQRFVFASSVYVYSTTGSFYRISKQACESLVHEYNRLYGLPYTIIRYGTLYGRRAGSNNAVSRMLTQALETGKIEYKGTGEEVREYIHVKDAAKLSVDILDPLYANKCLVLTGMHKMKNKELLEMIQEMLDNKVKIVYNPSHSTAHYKITPYSFTSPELGEKLTANPNIDMGQGLLDCMKEISEKAVKRDGDDHDADL